MPERAEPEIPKGSDVLECVINISEGRSTDVLNRLQEAAGDCLLDVHADAHHHRSVFTLAGSDVEECARALAGCAIDELAQATIPSHGGVHPKIGVVDVVPFIPLMLSDIDDAIRARNDMAAWMGNIRGVPAFLYGPERSLPSVRRNAFNTLSPDFGPSRPHSTAGASAVGARGVLVAYNLWLKKANLRIAKKIATALRRPGLRTLGLALDGSVQVSCNLTEPALIGPGDVFDLVVGFAPIERAELVGLIPADILKKERQTRWPELDLSEEKTIEARIRQSGLQ